MRSVAISLALALALAMLPTMMQGQTPYSGCVDRLHRPVVTIVDRSLPSAATAYIADGRPVIYWNSSQLAPASETARTFIYLHECAHHMLGHLYKPNDIRWENEADCWAIQHLVEGGAMRGRDIVALEQELVHWPGDPTHLGGTALVRSLQHCVDLKTDRRAWGAVLDGFLEASRDSFISVRRTQVPGVGSSPVYETTIDPPGTYDCLIHADASVVCSIFAGRTAKAASRRFHQIEEILQGLMRAGWTLAEKQLPGTLSPLQFHAMHKESGFQMSLFATDHFEVVLVMQPASP